MGFTPISNNILIKLADKPAEHKTKGGLYLPERSVNTLPMQGEVVAVGAGKQTKNGTVIPPSFAPGDTVVFGKYQGVELKLDGSQYIIIADNELLGVLTNE